MGTFLYGDLSPRTDEHCNVTTYEDGEAFASGLDVHMAVAGRQWSQLLLALLPAQDANVLRTDANPPVCAS